MTRTTKQQLIAIAILTGLNLLLSNLVVGNGRALDGHSVTAGSAEMHRAALVTYLVSVPMLSFVVGAAVAALPYRDKPYREKLLLYGLWILIGMQVFFLVAGVYKLVFMWAA